MKKMLRVSMLRLLKSAFVFDSWRYLHRNDIVILMLHGTSDPKHPSTWTPLRPQYSSEYIDWCMGIISKYYRFIHFEEAVNILKGMKPSMEYGITITMDDGYRNNIVDALPVFRKYNAPMTIFLPAANIENRTPMWFDRLDYIIQMANHNGKKFNIGNDTFSFSAKGRDDLIASYASFREMIKKQYTDEEAFYAKIDEIVSYFEYSSGKSLVNIFENDPWSLLLNWEEIKKYQGEEVQFGSHTMNHYRVNGLKEDTLRHQLFESKKLIETRTGNACNYIAYPDGDCSVTAKNMAFESGYDAGVTTSEGINKIGCDTMTLKRVYLPLTTDKTELLAYVSGFSKAVSYSKQE